MKDRKVILALSKLSVIELNSFTKFIHSPYFNVNEHITKLYLLILDHLKIGDIHLMEPKQLWELIFPKTPYNNQKFLKLTSDLTNLLEQFLAQKEFDASLSLKTQLKLEGVRKRGMEPLYNCIIGETERLQNVEINQSSEFYLQKYQIEKNIFSLKTENEKKNEKVEISTSLNLNNIIDNLDYFYIAEKLRLYCTLLSWKKMYKLEIEISGISELLVKVEKSNYTKIPAIGIYYTIYLTYKYENETSHYFYLKELLKTHLNIFQDDVQWELLSTAINYCINRVNKGDLEFQMETFTLYKQAIKNNLKHFSKSLTQTSFRNIVFLALRVEEFTWAENFILEYAKYVDEKYRTNAVEFSLARLEFYRKNYGKVLDHLNKVSFEDVWYNLNAKTIYLHTYYELNEQDALESLLQSFKMFIKREKSLTDDRKEHYLKLIKFTNALIKLYPRDKKKVLKLKDEIENTKGITSKIWLIEKVNEMLIVK